jgi:NADH dehydrogenase FAD-containing subunit
VFFQNIYAIGDCCNTPEEKMAAYCSAHAETVAWNIWRSMRHQEKISYKQRKNFMALNKTLDAKVG